MTIVSSVLKSLAHLHHSVLKTIRQEFAVVLIALLWVITENAAFAFTEAKCVSQGKVCVDDQEKDIDGFRVKECWKEKEVFKCSSEEVNNCAALEDNRGCNEVSGECKSQSPTGLCKTLEKVFTCGDPSFAKKASGNNQQTTPTTTETNIDTDTEIELIGSEFKVLKDEKDLSGCEQEEINKYCELVQEKCIEGAEARNINGKEVHKDCWKWDRQYQCRTNTFIDECRLFKENNACKEVRRDCIHEEGGDSSNGSGKARCEHYAVQYECENTRSEQVDCIASQFCIGDVCDAQARNVNTNFGKALSYLGVLSEAQKDGESCGCNKKKDPDCSLQQIDTNKCSLFRGAGYQCQRITRFYDCCADRGFAVPLFKCTKQEQELQSKQQAKVCAYVGAWKKGGWINRRLGARKRSYCCFNSPIAKVIQEQGRKQLGKGWGDVKNPDCGPLSLAEIQSLDFSKLDFSEIYDDLRAKATKDFGTKNKKMAEMLKSYQDNPEALAGVMKDKMQRFYGK